MTSRPRPDPMPGAPRPRPSDERARIADEGRTTRRVAVAALIVALVAVVLLVVRTFLPGETSCQQASWDVRPATADLPAGYTLSASQYDINRQQVTFLGPPPADTTTAQGVVYVTVTCFDQGAADAVARSEQAAKDASQTVTSRNDLGDGGFSATDAGGSTFVQLRHGDVVVYLAASSEVAAPDVDTLASAYDKALGGDGGAAAVGTPDVGGPSTAPGASDALPSDAAASGAAADPALEARLPTNVNGTALTVDSALGTDIIGEDQSSRAIVAALRADGKTAADLSIAQAYDETQAADLTILALTVDGLAEAKLKQLVLDTWLSASGSGITKTDTKIGNRTFTVVDYGDDGAKDYVLGENGAVIVITTADEALAKAAAAALP